MRWSNNKPQLGDTRVIIDKFLWKPKRIHDQTRWLEKASWQEKYTACKYGYTWIATDWAVMM